MIEEKEIIDHETEVKELFYKLTVELPGSKDLRVITLGSFKLAIDQMMNKAFYHGQLDATQRATSIVKEVFTH